jgi:hypothetical protein
MRFPAIHMERWRFEQLVAGRRRGKRFANDLGRLEECGGTLESFAW